MKILLCASKTPDTTSKITFSDDKKSLNAQGITYILNPYDDHGLGKAMELKEKSNAELVVIHVGKDTSKPVLDRCLAIGADKCIRIDDEPTDAYSVAYQIAEAVKLQNYDLFITGRESIDYNGSQVCDLLGEFLNIPSISFVTDLQIEGNNAKIKRFIDGGEEEIECTLPIVISATKELAEPRIPNMRGIMMARSKPTEVVSPTPMDNVLELVSLEPPIAKSGCKFIDASKAESLIDILHNTEKLI